MNLGWLHRFRAILPLVMALTALFILNGASWWAYRTSSEELKENFRRSVLALTEFLARQVEVAYRKDLEINLLRLELPDPPLGSLENPVPEFGVWLQSLPPTFLADLTPKKPVDPLFHDLYLLGGKGRLLGTWGGELIAAPTTENLSSVWEIHPLLAGDRHVIIRSLQNKESTVTREEVAAGGFFLTCYSPILYNEICRGLVGVRANLLFADRLEIIRRRVLFAAILGSILIAGLTWMSYQVLNQLDRTQERMAHRERLAQLGQMVSVVAHEIRNPLGIIEQTADLIRRKYTQENEDPLLGYVSEEVERLNRLVNRFLEFARPSESSVEPQSDASCDLARAVREIHSLLLPQAEGQGIDFRLQSPMEVPEVKGIDRERVRQILLNLVLNAFDATPAGKTVSLSLEMESSRILLEVSDEGCGMTSQQIQKATDPFFTTKEKGSGLGLALVAKMVSEARGTLQIDSQVGRGTSVTIYFKY